MIEVMDKILETLRLADVSGSGLVNRQVLKCLCLGSHPTATEAGIEELFHAAGLPATGNVDYAMFLSYVFDGVGNPDLRQANNLLWTPASATSYLDSSLQLGMSSDQRQVIQSQASGGFGRQMQQALDSQLDSYRDWIDCAGKEFDSSRSTEAFAILLTRSGHLPSSDELTKERMHFAVQALGLKHLGEIEVHRIWKRFRRQIPRTTVDPSRESAFNCEEFCKLVAVNTVLQSIVTSIVAREASMRFKVQDGYDYTRPSCENYRVKSLDSFQPKYAEFRKGGIPPQYRDYNYHSNYTPERQAWQDLIVEMTTQRHAPQPRPWIVFSCGAMGCGKGYAFEYMSQMGHFPIEKIVRIDPDFFKSLMPEWQGYVDANSDAGTLTHKESCFIQEICVEVALKHRQNIWVDGSLRDVDWNSKVFDDIRTRHPHYRIGIFIVHASKPTVLKRIDERRKLTGRAVPSDKFEQSYSAPPVALFELGPKSDWVIRVDNETIPTLVDFSSHDSTGNWSLVKSRFAKISHEPHEFPSALAPIAVRALFPHELGPLMNVGRRGLIGLSSDDTGLIARKNMGIPGNAYRFAWVPNDSNSATFPFGGWVFYDKDDCPAGGSCVMSQDARISQNVHFMEFKKPRQLGDLHSSLQDASRWVPVNLYALKQGGAEEYAFVLPGEQEMSGLGGFAYKMSDGTHVCFEIRVP